MQRYIDDTLVCYAEAEVFTTANVRSIINCPFYIRRIPSRSPQEHMEMQQVLEARQEAKEARELAHRSAQRYFRLTIGVGILTIAAVIVGALIGRGHILG